MFQHPREIFPRPEIFSPLPDILWHNRNISVKKTLSENHFFFVLEHFFQLVFLAEQVGLTSAIIGVVRDGSSSSIQSFPGKKSKSGGLTWLIMLWFTVWEGVTADKEQLSWMSITFSLWWHEFLLVVLSSQGSTWVKLSLFSISSWSGSVISIMLVWCKTILKLLKFFLISLSCPSSSHSWWSVVQTCFPSGHGTVLKLLCNGIGLLGALKVFQCWWNGSKMCRRRRFWELLSAFLSLRTSVGQKFPRSGGLMWSLKPP